MATETPTPEASSNSAAPPPAAATETAAPATGAFSGAEIKSPEAAPAGDKPGEAKPEGEQKPEAKAPDAYADFKLPEGVKIDADSITEFKGIAKELNLTQDAAQKIVELGPKFAEKWAKQQTDAIKATKDQWVTELKKDTQLGGEKLAENLAMADRGLNAYDKSGKLSQLLKETGLNNHAEVVRVFHEIGKSVKEDNVVAPDASGSPVASYGPGSLTEAAKIIYG